MDLALNPAAGIIDKPFLHENLANVECTKMMNPF